MATVTGSFGYVAWSEFSGHGDGIFNTPTGRADTASDTRASAEGVTAFIETGRRFDRSCSCRCSFRSAKGASKSAAAGMRAPKPGRRVKARDVGRVCEAIVGGVRRRASRASLKRGNKHGG